MYNRRNSLVRAINSALSQTHPPEEIIVVDDGSESEIEAYLLEAHPKIVSQIKIIRKSVNGGVSRARNLAVRNSVGQLLALLDSDDEWHPQKLAKQVAAFERDPHLSLVSCQQWMVHGNRRTAPNRKFYRFNLFNHLINGWHPPTPSSLLIKRSCLVDVPFDEDVRYLEDLDWWLKFSLLEPKIEWVNEFLMYYHLTEENRLSYMATQERFRKINKVLARWKERIVLERGERQYLTFQNHLYTYNALDAFVVFVRRRKFRSAIKMVTGYLWNRQEFYQLVVRRVLRIP